MSVMTFFPIFDLQKALSYPKLTVLSANYKRKTYKCMFWIKASLISLEISFAVQSIYRLWQSKILFSSLSQWPVDVNVMKTVQSSENKININEQKCVPMAKGNLSEK